MALTETQLEKLISNNLVYGKENQQCPTCKQQIKGALIVEQIPILSMRIVGSIGSGDTTGLNDWTQIQQTLSNFIDKLTLTGVRKTDVGKIVDFIKINYPNIIKKTSM